MSFNVAAQLDDLIESVRRNARRPYTIQEFVNGHHPGDEPRWRETFDYGFASGKLTLDEFGRVRLPESPNPEELPEPTPEEIILTLDEDGALT